MKKKPLMTGLVAKRALGHQIFSASSESVNIESIRPPSIMDELLDSMISVDSIVSEVVEPTMMGISNYETAMSDMDDSLTMRSCQDLSKDDETLANSSDFSSVESTPKKKNLQKQKRQSEKDRYMTYTIQVDMLLKEQQENLEVRKSLNARQRRQEDRQRFETQIISHDSDKTYNIDDDSSIHAMTKNLKFLREPTSQTAITRGTGEIRDKLNKIRQNTDESLEEERQNSETESQRDLKNSLSYDANISGELEAEVTPDKPKLLKNGKSSYISPYRMTSRLTPTKSKSVKVTKTPIIAKVVTRNPSPGQKKLPALRVNTNLKKSSLIVPKSAPVVASTKDMPSMPIRQGTFVKDEPTMENVPVVDPPPKPTISKLKPPTKISNPPEKTLLAKKTSNLPTSISQLKYRSNSIASMKSPVITPVRSNTGINLNNPKKNVTSKIAGIWKSGEKKESLLKKPTVSSSNSSSKLSSNGVSNARTAGKIGSKEIIKRSFTFDEIGKEFLFFTLREKYIFSQYNF